MAPNETNTADDIEALYASFLPECAASIDYASHAEEAFLQEYNAYAENGYKMDELQKPEEAVILGSEPRTMPPKDSAPGAGKMLMHSSPGSFVETGEGYPNFSSAVFYELAGAYKVPVLRVVKHTDTAASHKIRLRHTRMGGKQEVTEKWGKANARMTAARANLFVTTKNILNELGYDYFTKTLNFPMNGTEDQNFETAQTLVQSLWEIHTLRKMKEKRPSLPEPFMVVRDYLDNGQAYVFAEDEEKYYAVPRRETFATREEYESQMEALFTHFDPVFHASIRKESVEQTHYAEESLRLQPEGGVKNFLRKQAIIARARCADSRQTAPKEAAEGIGKVLYYRSAGGFLSDGEGNLLPQTKEFLENIATYENVKAFEIQQHSGCGAMNVIYSYYTKMESDPNYVLDHYGENFVKLAKEHADLYFSVSENIKNHGLDHYEKLGIKLYGTEAQKVQTCMAIEQGLRDYKLVEEFKAENPKTPIPMLMFQHLHEKGKMYVFNAKKGAFTAVPRADGQPMPAPRGGEMDQHVCSCGCCGTHNHEK